MRVAAAQPGAGAVTDRVTPSTVARRERPATVDSNQEADGLGLGAGATALGP